MGKSAKIEITEEAKRLLRTCSVATLATILPKSDEIGVSWPYASLVLMATAFDGSPLLLLSELAEHTKNIHENSKVSLLIDDTHTSIHRLAGSRITLIGKARRTENIHSLERYLRRHPEAESYLSFSDFHLYQVDLERAHLVAGFGKISWLQKNDIIVNVDEAVELAETEKEIVSHMNEEHQSAVEAYATKILGLKGLKGSSWSMTGCDTEGCDLSSGKIQARLDFGNKIKSSGEARKILADLAKSAKKDYI